MNVAQTTALDFIRLFTAVEILLVAIYLIAFAGIMVAIIAVVMRIPTLLWSPTETTCAICGDVGWCHEMNGQMVCPTCQIEIRPAKRWWEL